MVTKIRLDAPKTTPKKVAHKASEGTGEFIGTKISEPQTRNLRDGNRPIQTPVPSLNVEFTIPPKYLSNLWRSLIL